MYSSLVLYLTQGEVTSNCAFFHLNTAPSSLPLPPPLLTSALLALFLPSAPIDRCSRACWLSQSSAASHDAPWPKAELRGERGAMRREMRAWNEYGMRDIEGSSKTLAKRFTTTTSTTLAHTPPRRHSPPPLASLPRPPRALRIHLAPLLAHVALHPVLRLHHQLRPGHLARPAPV